MSNITTSEKLADCGNTPYDEGPFTLATPPSAAQAEGASVRALAASIKETAAHWAYMMEIDNGDAADAARLKHAEKVDQLAALTAAPEKLADCGNTPYDEGPFTIAPLRLVSSDPTPPMFNLPADCHLEMRDGALVVFYQPGYKPEASRHTLDVASNPTCEERDVSGVVGRNLRERCRAMQEREQLDEARVLARDLLARVPGDSYAADASLALADALLADAARVLRVLAPIGGAK